MLHSGEYENSRRLVPLLRTQRVTLSSAVVQCRMAHEFGSAAPVFRVANVRASLNYYSECLGFSVDWHAEGIASVTRDRCTIFLCEWDQGQRGTWAWIGVGDAEAVHEEFKARGAHIRQGPTNFSWALEIQVADVDGNVLRLGSEPKADMPYGSFLDGKGVLWDTPKSPQ